MTFFSLIFALVLEQLRDGGQRKRVISLVLSYADALERYFNTGLDRHRVAAWFVAVLPILAIALLIYYLLYSITPLLGWGWNVLILYLTMNFRQFSDLVTEIKEALKNDDVSLARELLKELHGTKAEGYSSGGIARVTIETGLIHSHRDMFGIIVSFILLPGPLGPLLYRLAELLRNRWGERPDDFGAFAVKAFEAIDWLPARATALSFAMAGNFEDAFYCWRAQAASWTDQNQGVILASGAGALGVCLGDPLREPGSEYNRPELGVGEEADVDFLQSTVGLIWRALVLWLLLLLLLEIANWAGGWI
jgi:adenosylcobinamide-phosphate synthase